MAGRVMSTAHEWARALVERCTKEGLKVAVAESCTGGLIAAAIIDVPGASAVFDRGFVAYSYAAKSEMLGVEQALIERHGAVSEQVAVAMAHGALLNSEADFAVGVTGIAGPGGGTPEKPVGLVFIAAAGRFGKAKCEEHIFPGTRDNIRSASVDKALSMLYEVAGE